LTDRDRVGHAVGAVDEADAGAEAVGADAAVVALGDTADEAAGDAVADAAADAVADEAPVVEVAGGEAEDDAPEVHPATLITAAAAAAATAARRLVDLVEPNIANLFPRPRRRS
jgi:hypothetical protein